MADSIKSWIGKAVIAHDEKCGADLQEVVRSGRYAQITQFDTYRTPADPHAQITGIISDRTNWVRVTFNVEETDEFERSKHGEIAETLTSHLRASIVIRNFRWRLAPPLPKRKLGDRKSMSRSNSAVSAMSTTSDRPNALELELPVVWMDILEWEVKAGDRNEPVYFEKTTEVGRGSTDETGKVQRVLRKWWTGETNSDMSQLVLTQEEAITRSSNHQSRRTLSPPKPDTARAGSATSNVSGNSEMTTARFRLDDGLQVTLIDYLEPFLSATGTKRKPIPDWIFEKPPGVQAQLDEIEMFGLSLDDLSEEDEHADEAHVELSPGPSEVGESAKAASREVSKRSEAADVKRAPREFTPEEENLQGDGEPAVADAINAPRLTPSQDDAPPAFVNDPEPETLSLTAPPPGQALPSTKSTASQPSSSVSSRAQASAGPSRSDAIVDSRDIGDLSSAPEDEDGSENDESSIPPHHPSRLRKRAAVSKTKRKRDRLAFASSSEPDSPHHPRDASLDPGDNEGEETDPDLLSDYERSRRSKRRQPASSSSSARRKIDHEEGVQREEARLPGGTIMPPAGQPTPLLQDEEEHGDGDGDVDMDDDTGPARKQEEESHSLPPSNASREKDMSLSKYATNPTRSSMLEPEEVEIVDEVMEERIIIQNTSVVVMEVEEEVDREEPIEDEEAAQVEQSVEKVPERTEEDDDADDEEEPRDMESEVEQEPAADEVEESEEGGPSALGTGAGSESSRKRQRPQPPSPHESPAKRSRNAPPPPIALPESHTSESETPRRSVLSYLNPFNLLRSSSRAGSGSPQTLSNALPSAEVDTNGPSLIQQQQQQPPSSARPTSGMWTGWRNGRDRSHSVASYKLSADQAAAEAEPAPVADGVWRGSPSKAIGSLPTPEPSGSPSPPPQASPRANRQIKKKERTTLPTPSTSPLSSRTRRAPQDEDEYEDEDGDGDEEGEPPGPVQGQRSISPKKEEKVDVEEEIGLYHRTLEVAAVHKKRSARAPKLGGWKPDLNIQELDPRWVTSMGRAIINMRQASAKR